MRLPLPLRLLRPPTLADERRPSIRQRLRAFGREVSDPAVLFWACWGLILAGIAQRYPSLAFQAEMFAENGTNLFYHARHYGLRENFLELEYYNYLFLFPRLIAVIAVKGLHLRESYAFVTEWCGHFLTAFFYAFFCLKRFRQILPSDLARFLLATALGIGLVGTYELYAFINFPYHGMFLMLILLFSSLDFRPRLEITGLTGLVFLICTSKVHPLAFLPFYAGALLLAARNCPGEARRKPAILRSPHTTFLAVTVLALLLQGGTTVVVNALFRTDTQDYMAVSPISALGDAGLYYLKAWLHFLFPTDFLGPQSAGFRWLVPWVLLPLWGVLASACVLHWKRGNRRVVMFFLVCNGLALLNMALTLYSVSNILQEFDWGEWFLSFQNRWFYLSLTAVFLGTVVLVATLCRNQFTQLILTVAMIAFVVGINRDFIFEHRYFLTTREESFSQWSLYAPLTDQPDYAIPVNPHPWILAHRSFVLGDVESENGYYELEGAELPRVRSAVVMESSSGLEEAYRLIALDRNGNELATGRLLTPAGYQHLYFLFEPLVGAARFRLVDAASRPFPGTLTLRFMGPTDEPPNEAVQLSPSAGPAEPSQRTSRSGTSHGLVPQP